MLYPIQSPGNPPIHSAGRKAKGLSATQCQLRCDKTGRWFRYHRRRWGMAGKKEGVGLLHQQGVILAGAEDDPDVVEGQRKDEDDHEAGRAIADSCQALTDIAQLVKCLLSCLIERLPINRTVTNFSFQPGLRANQSQLSTTTIPPQPPDLSTSPIKLPKTSVGGFGRVARSLGEPQTLGRVRPLAEKSERRRRSRWCSKTSLQVGNLNWAPTHIFPQICHMVGAVCKA